MTPSSNLDIGKGRRVKVVFPGIVIEKAPPEHGKTHGEAAVIIVCLFAAQKFGTATVGRLLRPVMILVCRDRCLRCVGEH